jgi:signal transduction histidine kinase
VLDQVIKFPEKINQLSTDEVKELVDELQEIKKENRESKKQMDEVEKKYKYDIRLLNVLATSGLKATSIAHEMHNKRNSIDENVDYIVGALKRYEMWDIVNEPENTQFIHRNIPGLLEKNQRLNKKMIAFMDVMLSETEKEQFVPEMVEVEKLFEDIKHVWEKDYTWVNIKLDIIEGLIHKSAKDIFRVVFDNLILNSIQQNDQENLLNIFIKITKKGKLVFISYSDDGKGLSPKYLDDPRRILEVHETSRRGGHGIGMWIVNNTINGSGGEILDIDGKNGFRINFCLGEKV